MSVSRVLILLLLAAAVLADLAVLSWTKTNTAREPGLTWPDLRLPLLFSLVFAQVGLAAIWAVLGRTVLPWRVAGLVAVVVGWSAMLAVACPGAVGNVTTDDIWAIQLLIQAGLVAVVLIPARAYGAHLAGSQPRHQQQSPRGMQFSLGYLFAWLTSTAIVLSMLKYTFDLPLIDEPSLFWQNIGAFSAVNAALALLVLWAVLDTRRWRVRLLAMGITAVPAALVVFAFWIRNAGVEILEILAALAVLWLLETLWLAIAVRVARTAGYRLVWRGLIEEAD